MDIPPTSTADMAALTAGIGRPDAEARSAARAVLRSLGPGTMEGRLGQLAVWLAGVCAVGMPQRPLLVVLNGDDPAPVTTTRIVAATHPGLRVLAAPVAPGVFRALEDGAGLADAEVDAGTDMLLVAAPYGPLLTPAATVVATLTGMDAPAVVAKDGVDDDSWMRTCASVRDGMRRARPVANDPARMLGVLGSPELALLAGLLLRSAARRTPAVLDGPTPLAAALVAHRAAADAAGWWLVAHHDDDPAAGAAMRHLALEPLLDLGLRGRDGTAATLTLPLLRAAIGLVGG